MAIKEKKANRNSTIIFLIGLAIFALGIIAYLLRWPVSGPSTPSVTLNDLTLYALFLNWLVIIGIVVMVVGFVIYYIPRKRKN